MRRFLHPPGQLWRVSRLGEAGAWRCGSLAAAASCLGGKSMEEAPVPELGERGSSLPPAKKPRLLLEAKREKRAGLPEEGKGRYVPPPKKRNPGVSFNEVHFAETSYYFEGGLRKVRPYYFDFQNYCKGRWVGKSLLHVFDTEFRAQPLEYYQAAAKAGRLRLNEQPVRDLNVILKNNDFLRNTVHRHEPPVTAQTIEFLEENDEVVVVNKPSSLPVHPCGRFRHNTVIFILGKEHNLKELHTVHRLDRLTSGVLMFAKSAEASKRIDEQVRQRQLEKEYVCRVVGEFPENEVICEEPIMVVSYKVGVCRVDPKGKVCKTVFQRLSYNGKTSVVKCYPYTGRTHQIRVHLQFLGHPIVNDPIYNTDAWGPEKGKGGNLNKTDEELLRALLEEHLSKQSLSILDIAEEDLKPITEDNVQESPGNCVKPRQATLVNVNSGSTEALKDVSESETSVCSQDLVPQVQMCRTESGEMCSAEQPDDKDPLCAECKVVRPDPSPKDLVMYLHALRYKGAEFEYCSQMPDWAQDDWEET
ncbi:RNA pseudouridylate synthase domain-containing protein 2 [Varanus komodoensis]|uniref:Pseudouridylate synthase RPUSD2 n=1 Tax=Varanus komodoensis TaxID=61221 RepID=A0A8D2L6K3_VARKO|nr:RNA pseudouridylate synthase domain-containing protein 2 [Varanus komodoensis]KAF7251787.1 RNA pseudouridylate synthase domain-containing protein 2 [Varanus komodoensis]